MTEYMVFYYIKLSAKNNKDLNRKAEIVGEALTKFLKKRVTPHGYAELEKQDKIQVTKQTTLEGNYE